MATPEALTKYYDCLKDSFNKIQVKNNKAALVNAALRPKIREEFAKSKSVLVSYLDYLKVFILIYSDRFSNICINIICPLFRDNPFKKCTVANQNSGDSGKDKDTAQLVHETVRFIFKSKPELIDEFIHSLVRLFPNIHVDNEEVFTSYLSNALEVCTYIRGEPLTNLLAKILDRVNPPSSSESIEEQRSQEIIKAIRASYDLIYEKVDSFDGEQLESFSAAFLSAFAREFLTSANEDAINYLVLYLCSRQDKLADLFINMLWASFTDADRSFDERQASVMYACSFIARASYICLGKVLNHIEIAVFWCRDYINNNVNSEDSSKNIDGQAGELFYPLVESVLYLITQRYREMYEQETIDRLENLNLDEILINSMKPLDVCDPQTVSRFSEVATLYEISSLSGDIGPTVKRRRSSPNRRRKWKVPFKESCDKLPLRVSNLYRTYYNHRNFTIYRE